MSGVPYDKWPTRTVVGCTVATPKGARLAAARVKPVDIWDPRLRRIFEAAIGLGDAVDDENRRIQAIATVAGVDVAEVERLVAERPCMWDLNGGFAQRVVDESRRRQVMALAAKIYNAIEEGAMLDEIGDDLRHLEAVV